MAWLSRVGVDSSYLIVVALPMVLVGAVQGLALAPLTSAGLALVLALVLIVPSEVTTRRASRRAAASPDDAVDERELDVREEPVQSALT